MIAHALTFAATEQALAAGVDGLAHLFIDRSHTRQIIDVNLPPIRGDMRYEE